MVATSITGMFKGKEAPKKAGSKSDVTASEQRLLQPASQVPPNLAIPGSWTGKPSQATDSSKPASQTQIVSAAAAASANAQLAPPDSSASKDAVPASTVQALFLCCSCKLEKPEDKMVKIQNDDEVQGTRKQRRCTACHSLIKRSKTIVNREGIEGYEELSDSLHLLQLCAYIVIPLTFIIWFLNPHTLSLTKHAAIART